MQSIERARSVQLTNAARVNLDQNFPAGRLLRTPRAARRPIHTKGEVVLIMGAPGSGKSRLSEEFVTNGYQRLNRDILGGSLRSLIPYLDKGLENGEHHWVLDNTYPTRASRNHVIETAWNHGVAARCIWLQADAGHAQMNAVIRMVRQHGGLPTPLEIRELGKNDSSMFGPDALHRYNRALERPCDEEGFTSVSERPAHALQLNGTGRAIFIDIDAAKYQVPSVSERLQQLAGESWKLAGYAWRPKVEEGTLTADAVARELDDFRKTLGVSIITSFCPHRAGPPRCWCRIPLPGLLVEICEKYDINPLESVLVGDSPADRTLARTMKMEYSDLQDWLSNNDGH